MLPSHAAVTHCGTKPVKNTMCTTTVPMQALHITAEWFDPVLSEIPNDPMSDLALRMNNQTAGTRCFA